ncbi:MAG: MBL fold metallo-hydrolase [Candidatus Hodarchaeota archaeon]
MGSTSINELFEVNLENNEIAFIYLGFAGIILRAKKKTIAIDIGEKCLNSRNIMEIKNLDIQLYSHTHWDHFDIDVTTKIFAHTNANIVAEPQVFEELKRIMTSEVSALHNAKPGETIILNGFEVAIVGGIHPRPISIFRIKWDNFSIFHGADSGPVPLDNYPANVAFLPTGTPSPTCSPENALKMAFDIKPRTIVTMHGSQKQMEKFKAIAKKKIPNVTVVIPKQNEVTKIIS